MQNARTEVDRVVILFAKKIATRLQEPWVKNSPNRYGLGIAEGIHHVLRLECLNVAAIALGSNKVTAEQLENLVRYARTVANNQVLLLPDCDKEGETGFKDLLWKLCEAQVEARLPWSSETHPNRQPESLTQEEWNEITAGNLRRA